MSWTSVSEPSNSIPSYRKTKIYALSVPFRAQGLFLVTWDVAIIIWHIIRIRTSVKWHSLVRFLTGICYIVWRISLFICRLTPIYIRKLEFWKSVVWSVGYYSWAEYGLELMFSHSFLSPNPKQYLLSFPFPYHYTILLGKFTSDLKRLKIKKGS
jgi:hypothetical protein